MLSGSRQEPDTTTGGYTIAIEMLIVPFVPRRFTSIGINGDIGGVSRVGGRIGPKAGREPTTVESNTGSIKNTLIALFNYDIVMMDAWLTRLPVNT